MQIEEMYKVYGVRKLGCRGTKRLHTPCEYGNEIWQKCKNEGLECAITEFHYPSFTTEKQLEIIKLIGDQKSCLIYFSKTLDKWVVCYREIFEEDQDFTQALVKLVIALKDELEHTKVREILE